LDKRKKKTYRLSSKNREKNLRNTQKKKEKRRRKGNTPVKGEKKDSRRTEGRRKRWKTRQPNKTGPTLGAKRRSGGWGVKREV